MRTRHITPNEKEEEETRNKKKKQGEICEQVEERERMGQDRTAAACRTGR